MPPLAPPIDTAIDSDISAMETRFFACRFADETPEQRLDRIERLVYGARRKGSVKERVSRLLLDVPDLARQTQSSASSPASMPAAQAADSPRYEFSAGSIDHSLTQELACMEKEVYGKTYAKESLPQRVARLENTVFAGQTPQTFTPIVMRINRLLAALEPKFKAEPANNASARPYEDVPSYTPAYAPENTAEKKKGHPFVHKLGKVLAGIGTVAGETLGAVAAGSMMGYGYGYGYGGYGFGYPGMYYPGAFGYGFGPRPFMGCW